MILDEMDIDKISVGEMKIDKISAAEKAVHEQTRQNVCR
jgi:hypothetical protein